MTEIPNEAPQVTPEEAKTTEFETVTGVVLAEGVLDKETESPRTFTKYEFVETRPTETGVKHIYKPILEEVPNEAPQVTPEEAKTTEFETVTGVVLAEGVLDKETENPRTFTKYEFVETRPTETGVKHIYKPIVEEVPNEAPKHYHEKPRVTHYRYVDKNDEWNTLSQARIVLLQWTHYHLNLLRGISTTNPIHTQVFNQMTAWNLTNV